MVNGFDIPLRPAGSASWPRLPTKALSHQSCRQHSRGGLRGTGRSAAWWRLRSSTQSWWRIRFARLWINGAL